MIFYNEVILHVDYVTGKDYEKKMKQWGGRELWYGLGIKPDSLECQLFSIEPVSDNTTL